MLNQMKPFVLLITILLFSRTIFACDNWSNTDSILLGSAIYASYLDYESTIYFLHHSRIETNPFFGTPKPSDTSVLEGTIIAVIGATFISCYIEKLRLPFLITWNIVEYYSEWQNQDITHRRSLWLVFKY